MADGRHCAIACTSLVTGSGPWCCSDRQPACCQFFKSYFLCMHRRRSAAFCAPCSNQDSPAWCWPGRWRSQWASGKLQQAGQTVGGSRHSLCVTVMAASALALPCRAAAIAAQRPAAINITQQCITGSPVQPQPACTTCFAMARSPAWQRSGATLQLALAACFVLLVSAQDPELRCMLAGV